MAQKTLGDNLSFRVSRELADWLHGEAERKGVRMGQAAREMIILGHEYLRALEPVRPQIEATAILEGISREALVTRILQEAVKAHPLSKKK